MGVLQIDPTHSKGMIEEWSFGTGQVLHGNLENPGNTVDFLPDEQRNNSLLLSSSHPDSGNPDLVDPFLLISGNNQNN